MRRVIVFSMAILTALTASAKGDWRGKVVDEKGEPVAYANVAVLSKADSTVLCGAVTEEDGTFNIVTRESDGIMMVAM
ncbi:MAG: carboxypeptidase regulatory-like domain-containing protein, partial [Bacteroidales bacterium]|nr:carboxypeptidase regulatory-like domain-containing protein [Bacteroidales bacterium]